LATIRSGLTNREASPHFVDRDTEGDAA
jgi:hypothetical protein